ncbi:XrtA system polysaccharide chain length determinant [Paraglaciecola sp. MB-3u-78]|jgi:polysaccharide chain length determinant protein (PEP-CTERM system associated)|uniref:XrtA system polysaccharide chain length determinant n=1 Tax=Paraglaciecola sp. MB-3u-78 TaxID=2058332 RepID=UPI000C34FA2D|nr:XrtA system polysaccharide chain length determinant [Paraglaciecola sp. MB-3u-78]PKG93028.1 chain-length determining protein [Paraglaciecola sp. MB-3u-78]
MQDLQKTLELLIDYIKGVWVKKRYIMICTWLICPLGFVYVASMPNVYESSARVYVDTRSVLQPLLRGLALQTDPRQEVAMMVQTLLSRPNIEIIARESDLDITASNAVQYENLINSLSNSIRLRAVGRDNLYTISYSHRDPQMARTVVQETLDLFVEGTKGNSRKDTDAANQFIDEQIDEYESRLSASEQRLANFKRKYADLLPNQGSFYGNYSTLEQNLEQTRLTIKETEQQIVALSDQIQGRKTNQDGSSVRPFDGPSSLTTRYDSRIKTLEENLDQLMLKYTELHPDVIEANNLLDSLLASRKLEIEEYLSSNDGEKPEQIGSIASELKLEISRLESQVASLRVRETDYDNKLEALKQKIDLVPQVEAERTALNRDYEVTQRKYQELLVRKDQAELAQKADVSAEDVQFRVVDPPIAPQSASGPNRLLNYTIALALGFASGLGLAFLISQLNPILLRSSQLTTLTSYPVLGMVSHLNKAHIKKVRRSRLLIFVFSSSLIIGLYGVLMAAEIMKFDIYARVFS